MKDGDKVQAGQVLVELDPTVATADKSSIQEQLYATLSEAFRTRELLKMLSNKELSVQLTPEQSASFSSGSFTPALQTAVLAQSRSEQLDIRAKHAKFNAEISRRQAEIYTVQAGISKLQTTIPMAQTREADFKNLVGEGFISSHATQDKTRERRVIEYLLSPVQRAGSESLRERWRKVDVKMSEPR